MDPFHFSHHPLLLQSHLSRGRGAQGYIKFTILLKYILSLLPILLNYIAQGPSSP
jgi:hypothetical protein